MFVVFTWSCIAVAQVARFYYQPPLLPLFLRIASLSIVPLPLSWLLTHLLSPSHSAIYSVYNLVSTLLAGNDVTSVIIVLATMLGVNVFLTVPMTKVPP